jgi:hypothetical protein
MRPTSIAGSLVAVAAWSFAAFAQSAAPPASPPVPTTPPAPAPPSPPASSPEPAPSAPPPEDGPKPTEPAPPSTPSAAPEQPSAPPESSPAEPPPPAPPASATIAPTPPPPPALATQQPPPKEKPAPKTSERAPTEKQKSDPWQDGHALALEISGRGSARLNAASSTANYEERAGLGIDGSLWFTLSPEYVIGLGVKRVDLGEISKTSGVNTIDAGYATTAFELGMRAFPYRSKNWDIFLGLRAGLAWQDVEANGLEQVGPMPDSAQQFNCSGGAGPGFALGAEVGAGFRLSRYLWLTGTVDANGFRLSSDVVDDCIAGLGAVATISVGLGLLYAFDIGSDAKLGSSSPKQVGRR